MPDDRLSRVFAALADPTRRDFVARLTLGDETVAGLVTFWGSFHEVRSPDRLVQTQSMAGAGDGAVLNTLTFEDLGGRTRLTDHTLVDTLEGRDAILASGMDQGVIAGYRKLDELLQETSGRDVDPGARRSTTG